MNKLFKPLAAFTAAAMLLTGSALPSFGSEAVPTAELVQVEAGGTIMDAAQMRNAYTVITNAATGRVIAVQGGGTNNLDLITVEEPGTANLASISSSKVWRLAPLAGGMCYMVNQRSGRSLDVPDAKKEDGIQLIQYSYNGNSQQKMTVSPVDGGFTIKPSHADMYLADQDGKLVQISDPTAENAKWTFAVVSDALMNRAKESEGYKLLGEEQKRAFDTYFFSSLDLSLGVFNSAETLLSTSNYFTLTPAEQMRVLSTALTYTSSGQVVGNVVNETVAPYKIVSKEQVENFDIWRGSRCTAWVFQIEMEGDVPGQVHKFQFATNEEDPDAEMITKSIEAIGVFPYALRQHMHYLYWKKGDTANSYNGGGNSIWIRLTWEPTRQQISQTLSHELGHVLEQNMLQDPDVWSLAERLDCTPISSYGSSNETEDLAEFSRLYWTNLGKDTFAELERVYPNRYKVFTGLLYRADNEYFKDYAENEKYIDELTARSRAAGSDSDASSLDEGKLYKIIDNRTDKVLTVPNNSTGNDVALTVEQYTAKAGQHFRIEKYGEKIKIISANSNKPIQLDDSAMSSKSIAQYGGTWAIDERFAVYPLEDGRVYLFAPRYELYISPFGDAAGQAVEPYPWRFVEVGESDTKVGKLHLLNCGYVSVSPADEETGVGTVTIVKDKENASTFKISGAEGPDTFKIIDMATGLSLDILNSSTAQDANVIAYEYLGTGNQLFQFETVSGGIRIKNLNSGLYLKAQGRISGSVYDYSTPPATPAIRITPVLHQGLATSRDCLTFVIE